MPIRPEDFDASPPRRNSVDGSPGHRDGAPNGDDRRKKRQETNSWQTWFQAHWSGRAAAVSLAALAVVLTMVASEKPLVRLVRNLLSEKKPVVVEPVKTPRIQEAPTNPEPKTTVVPHADSPVAEPPKQPQISQTSISKSRPVPRQIRKPPADKTPQQNDEAQELKRQLEEQQAELERKQQQLSDAQSALEEQKQAAQENLSGPFAPPLGLKDIEMAVKVMSPMGTVSSSVGDGFSAMVLAPRNYAGAILAGHIVSVRAAKDHDKPEISLQLETLTFQDKRHLIQADLREVANSKGFNNVDEEGRALGKSSKKKKSAAAGGIFGAAMRGAKTAVVGSGSGADLLFTIKFTTNAAQIELAPGSMFTLRVSDRKQR
jgi:hypothetical protein